MDNKGLTKKVSVNKSIDIIFQSLMVTQHHHRAERLLAAWPRTSTPCSSRSRFSRVLTTSTSGKRSQERSTSRPFSNSSTGSSNRQKSKLFAKNKDWMTICITRYYFFPVEVDFFLRLSYLLCLSVNGRSTFFQRNHNLKQFLRIKTIKCLLS